MNPIYQQLNNNQNNLMLQFRQFRDNFQGNPQQQIQQMLNSGRVSQEQYNRAVQMTNKFFNLFR